MMNRRASVLGILALWSLPLQAALKPIVSLNLLQGNCEGVLIHHATKDVFAKQIGPVDWFTDGEAYPEKILERLIRRSLQVRLRPVIKDIQWADALPVVRSDEPLADRGGLIRHLLTRESLRHDIETQNASPMETMIALVKMLSARQGEKLFVQQLAFPVEDIQRFDRAQRGQDLTEMKQIWTSGLHARLLHLQTLLSQSPEKFLEELDITHVRYSAGATWEDEGLRPFYGIYTAFELALNDLYTLKRKPRGPKVGDVLWSVFLRATDFGLRDGIQKLNQRILRSETLNVGEVDRLVRETQQAPVARMGMIAHWDSLKRQLDEIRLFLNKTGLAP